jgi:hypothetical protein
MNKLGLPTILFLIFLVLKLTKYITWSWVWVCSPLWIAFVLGDKKAAASQYNKDISDKEISKEDTSVWFDATVVSVVVIESRTELVVSSPIVKFVNFKTAVPLEKGDEIQVRVFKAEVAKKKPYFDEGKQIWMRSAESTFVSREFKETETATVIRKIKDGLVMFEYRIEE